MVEALAVLGDYCCVGCSKNGMVRHVNGHQEIVARSLEQRRVDRCEKIGTNRLISFGLSIGRSDKDGV